MLRIAPAFVLTIPTCHPSLSPLSSLSTWDGIIPLNSNPVSDAVLKHFPNIPLLSLDHWALHRLLSVMFSLLLTHPFPVLSFWKSLYVWWQELHVPRVLVMHCYFSNIRAKPKCPPFCALLSCWSHCISDYCVAVTKMSDTDILGEQIFMLLMVWIYWIWVHVETEQSGKIMRWRWELLTSGYTERKPETGKVPGTRYSR